MATASIPFGPFPPPGAISCFTFGEARMDASGAIELHYALDDVLGFTERIEVPVPCQLSIEERDRLRPLVDLLHWVAGVSYYKSAVPLTVGFTGPRPGPAAAALLEALYSEGLGEHAYRNGIDLPRPRFAGAKALSPAAATPLGMAARLLVPIGGGKDSIASLEALRERGRPITLFSVGTPVPIEATARASGLEWLVARRFIDPQLLAYNQHGALNGHVPVTAIVSCVAALTAAAHEHAAVAMSNERSASAGNVRAYGIDVNHQFSKGLRAERLMRAALQEQEAGVDLYSVLRGASELSIARYFATLDRYHHAFTSCNAVFRLDPDLRGVGWCGDCPKCRFVFLALAPSMAPEALTDIFGRDLLADESQLAGFSKLAARGGHKPFECVGEEREAHAAFALLADDSRWRDHAVVRRFVDDAPAASRQEAELADLLAWSDDHELPADLADDVRAAIAPSR